MEATMMSREIERERESTRPERENPALPVPAFGKAHAACALLNAGTGRAGFSLSGRVLSLSLSISRDIAVASIPYITKPKEDTGRTQSH